MNKFKLLILIAVLLNFTILFGSAFVQFFDADSNGDNIILTWQTSDEQNVQQFEILRGPDKDNLTSIATIASQGNNSSYTYIDKNAYKTNSSFYAYGLVVVDYDGSKTDPLTIGVKHDGVSGIKNTWGSIKALFR
ncbi:MAG: hypothetical protein GY936_14765 [Ignavibacteriae bacterium]|nr:hypothetical protein [Ignavibacteriota bacterium]